MAMKEKISLQVEVDLNGIRDAIKTSEKLEDRKLFEQLAQVDDAKSAVKAVLAEVEEAEAEAKALINERAKKMLGEKWEAIEGDGFKITRSMTGAVYVIDEGVVDDGFVKKEVKPDTDAIEEFHKNEGKYPDGVQPNEKRGDRITIKAKK